MKYIFYFLLVVLSFQEYVHSKGAEVLIVIDDSEINSLELKIGSLVKDENVDSINVKANCIFSIDRKYLIGYYVFKFVINNDYYVFGIPQGAKNMFIKVNVKADPSCILTNFYNACDATTLGTYGENCYDYNYLAVNVCDLKGHSQFYTLNSPSNFSNSYYDELRSDKLKGERIYKKLNDFNGKYLVIKRKCPTLKGKLQKEIEIDTISFDCGLSENWDIINDNEGVLLIGFSQEYTNYNNPFTFEKVMSRSSCPSYWYILLKEENTLIEIGETISRRYLFKMNKNKLILNQISHVYEDINNSRCRIKLEKID